VEWSVQVKNYLMAHDLWYIIEATTEAPRREDDEAAFRAWSKKNFMALHVIQISCGTDTFSSIKWISTAKNAWDTLAGKYYNVPQTSNSGLSLSFQCTCSNIFNVRLSLSLSNAHAQTFLM
jgi:hypothetical protein